MKKKIISLFICAIMIVSTVIGMTITSSADSTYHPTLGWYISNGIYGYDANGENNLTPFSKIISISVNSPKTYINASVSNGVLTSSTTFNTYNVINLLNPSDKWFPVETMSPSSVESGFADDGDESVINFKLGSSMQFGNANGYNGMVSLAWYFASNGFDFARDSYGSTPDSLHYSNYNEALVNSFRYYYDMAGGIGPQIAHAATSYGVTLTLYPDVLGTGAGTRNVKHFRIFLKKNAVITTSNTYSTYDADYEIYDGDFSTAIDLSYDTMVKLERDTTNDSISFQISQDGTNWTTLSAQKLRRNVVGYDDEREEPIFAIQEVGTLTDTIDIPSTVDLSDIMFNKTRVAISAMGAWNSDATVIVNSIN